LVDDDRVEPHNLDAMDLLDTTDIGKQKVHAICQRLNLAMQTENGSCLPLPYSVGHGVALEAIKTADIIVCCADNDAARMICASIATLFQRVLLDIGSGVHHNPDGQSHLGGDIRLILPGEHYCLNCFGGVAEVSSIQQVLDRTSAQTVDWRLHRAGSLRSLNAMNVHLGVRMLEELLVKRLSRSSWIRLDYAAGLPNLQHFQPQPLPDCDLCYHTAQADRGLSNLHGILRGVLKNDLRYQP
jgi:hypothetical protein